MRIGIKRTLRIQTNELEQFLSGASATTLGELLHLRLDKHRRVQRRERVLINHGDFAAAKLILFLLGHLIPLRKAPLRWMGFADRFHCEEKDEFKSGDAAGNGLALQGVDKALLFRHDTGLLSLGAV